MIPREYRRGMPRRRTGVLLPLESAILDNAITRLQTGEPDVHCFALASDLEAHGAVKGLLGHGTLYKALARLERANLLESRWEEIEPAVEGRPRRRLYRITPAGAAALASASRASASTRLATS